MRSGGSGKGCLGCPIVPVLSPLRTFWEKATLVHVECQRQEARATAGRLSRHWYDLAKLADLPIGHEAVERRDLLVEVVKIKKIFYHSGSARYDDCLEGRLRLVPGDPVREVLARDFEAMRDAGMFLVSPDSFDLVVSRLAALEVEINRARPQAS